MQCIEKESLFDLQFLSALKMNPEGTHAAFVVTAGDLTKNSYSSHIHVLDIHSHKITQLTNSDSEKGFIWLDDKTLLFPAARTEDEKTKISKGYPVTYYYSISLSGGEAQRLLTIERRCKSIKILNDHEYLLLVNNDLNEPSLEGLNDTEGDKVLKDYRDRSEACSVFDELPFWANGQGIINKKRTQLVRYNSQDNTYTEISEPLMDVNDVYLNDEGSMVLYSGSSYQDYYDQSSKLFLYKVSNQTQNEVILDKPFAISFAVLKDQEILMYGIGLDEMTSYINRRFYTMPISGGAWQPANNLDISIGSGIGSDCRYGGNQKVIYKAGKLHYIRAERVVSHIYALDENYQEGQVSLELPGSIDGFDVSAHQYVYIATRKKGLPEIYLYNTLDKEEICVSSFNQPWLKNHVISYPEYFVFNTADGTELDGFVIKPVDYDSDKRYPGILDIHGGPKAIFGDVLFHEMQWWAAQGYFVFYTNPRGSDGRGSEFADIEGERYGTMDYEDIMTFTDVVISRYPALDENRLGVTGGSYGGLMTNWIVGHTDRFKAAAAQRSIANYTTKCLTTDIGYYHNLRQMGGFTPWNGADILWDHSPLKYADRVKTPLLLLHSDEDYRCYMGDALQMFTALKMFGVDTKFCLFHGENHELSRSGKPKNRIRRLEEITHWMDTYLK